MQSVDGTVANLAAVAEAADAVGALTIVDATHAIGWLPFDAARFDAVACAAYKWLLSTWRELRRNSHGPASSLRPAETPPECRFTSTTRKTTSTPPSRPCSGEGR